LAVFEGHQGPVRGAVVLDSGTIASYSDDGTLRLWDDTGAPRAVLPGHVAIHGLRAIRLADGAERLLSWSHFRDDNTAKLWDPVNGACLGVIDLAGRRRLVLDEIIGAAAASSIALEDERPSGGRFNPYDPREIRVSGGDGAIALPDGREAHWKARVPPPMESQSDFALRIAAERGDVVRLEGHTDEVLGAMVLDPSTLLSWSRDGTLRLWNLDPLGPAGVLAGHKGGVLAALRLGDRHILSCSEDGTLRLWDPSDRRVPAAAPLGHTGTVTHDLVVSDRRLLTWRVSSDDQKAILWNPADGRAVAALEHRAEIDGAVLVEGGRILTWSREHYGFYAGGAPDMYDLSGLGTTYAEYVLWSAASGRRLDIILRAEAVRLFPGLDAMEYRERAQDAGAGVSIGIVIRDHAAETANACREASGPCDGSVLRTDGRCVALTALGAGVRADGAGAAEWHASARLWCGPMFAGGTVAVYEEGGGVRFLGPRRGLQRLDWRGAPAPEDAPEPRAPEPSAAAAARDPEATRRALKALVGETRPKVVLLCVHAARETAQRLARELEAAGLACAGYHPGTEGFTSNAAVSRPEKVVAVALAEADLAIHLHSRRGLRQSLRTLAGVAAAEHARRGLPLLRVRLQPCDTPDELAGLDWIDVFGGALGQANLEAAIAAALAR
jgi:hypothetical protein